MGEFILLHNDQAYYGTLEDLEEVFSDLMDEGADVEDFSLSRFSSIDGVEFKTNLKVDCEVTDKEYDETDEEYFITDDDKNRVVAEHLMEDEVADTLADLIADSGDCKEDRFVVGRKVEFACLYKTDIERSVNIVVPPEPPVTTPQVEYSEMSDEEIYRLIGRLSNIVNNRKDDFTDF